MANVQILLLAWLIVTVTPFVALITYGIIKLHLNRLERSPGTTLFKPIEILIPLKGTYPDQEKILTHMLQQNYPNYRVTFILESVKDPANEVVDRLCAAHQHASKIISGISESCAQKNFNLLAGINNLHPATEVIVFCDSTNLAEDPSWLDQFTAPLRHGRFKVATTFRVFKPKPETLGGVCQAIYGAFILLLTAGFPKPWGGGTAILRKTFEDLNVAKTWAKTVVDDLVLGNILHQFGINVGMDSSSLLISPLRNQSVKGFLDFLDRQILFPKFTNPEIWMPLVVIYSNLTAAIAVVITILVMFPIGYFERFSFLIALGFLGILLVIACILRTLNPLSISFQKWLLYFFPCLLLHSFVIVRSIFRRHIDWHGRRYWPGKGGVILRSCHIIKDGNRKESQYNECSRK